MIIEPIFTVASELFEIFSFFYRMSGYFGFLIDEKNLMKKNVRFFNEYMFGMFGDIRKLFLEKCLERCRKMLEPKLLRSVEGSNINIWLNVWQIFFSIMNTWL